jgi:CBS domain-containing protein
MKTAGDLLAYKGHNVLTITPDTLVYDAIYMLAQHEIGALIVKQGNRVVGIFSERDYARKIILQDRSSRSTRVEEVMTTNVVYAEPSQSIDDCMSLMTNKRVRHLPVMDHGSLVGIVSIGDLVREIISDQQSTIELLEQYIKA